MSPLAHFEEWRRGGLVEQQQEQVEVEQQEANDVLSIICSGISIINGVLSDDGGNCIPI